MRRSTVVAACGAATLLVSAPVRANAQFHWQGHLAAGKQLEIKDVNGDIRATPASGDQVEVTAVKHAQRSDTASVEIRVVPSDEGVTICAVYPPLRHEGPNDCTPGRRNHSNTENNDVVVDFTVHLPAGIVFSAHTVNGAVDAEGLGGNVEAVTVNGSVRVSTAGYAEAQTVNGSITATLGRADWPDAMEFQTVNGSVTITLPSALSTEVQAETVNGDIESDFPLMVSGRFGPRHVNGTIGNGGRRLELRTVNGGIHLRKAT
jgi:Putative adhesin